jgi:hypothetical protein
MSSRRCSAIRADGRACGAVPLRDGPACFWHSAETAEDAAKARRLGGLRRRREKAVAGAYDLVAFDSIPGLRRIIEIAALDALDLDNSPARSRVLIACVFAALRLNLAGDLEARVAALEGALAGESLTPGRGYLDGGGADASAPEGALAGESLTPGRGDLDPGGADASAPEGQA